MNSKAPRFRYPPQLGQGLSARYRLDDVREDTAQTKHGVELLVSEQGEVGNRAFDHCRHPLADRRAGLGNPPAGQGQQRRAEVEQGHRVALRGQRQGVATGTAAGIQNTVGAILCHGWQLPLQRVHRDQMLQPVLCPGLEAAPLPLGVTVVSSADLR